MYGEQRGAAPADFDGDGRLHLAVAQDQAAIRLYRNRSARPGLGGRLVGPEENRDGIGSSVRLVYADGSEGTRREVQAGSGYWSQNEAAQILGAAPEKTAAHIAVTWFDGTSQSVDVRSGQRSYIIRYP